MAPRNRSAARLSQDLLLTSEISPLTGLSGENAAACASSARDAAPGASTERVNKLDPERHSAAVQGALD